MDSIREQIFAAIETSLRGIAGIGTVSRGKLDPLYIQAYPSAHVFAGSDTVIEYLGLLILRKLTVLTYGWIRSQDNVHKTIEAFVPKIQAALAADYTLGGLVIDITEVNVDEPMLNAEETEAVVLFEHTVTYRVLRLDPYTRG